MENASMQVTWPSSCWSPNTAYIYSETYIQESQVQGNKGSSAFFLALIEVYSRGLKATLQLHTAIYG